MKFLTAYNFLKNGVRYKNLDRLLGNFISFLNFLWEKNANFLCSPERSLFMVS